MVGCFPIGIGIENLLRCPRYANANDLPRTPEPAKICYAAYAERYRARNAK